MERRRMQTVTINLPIKHLDFIEGLINAGYYNSRSEFIRAAVLKFLFDNYNLIKELERLPAKDKKLDMRANNCKFFEMINHRINLLHKQLEGI